VVTFKCDLSPTVSIIYVWKGSDGHKHHFPLSFHVNTP